MRKTYSEWDLFLAYVNRRWNFYWKWFQPAWQVIVVALLIVILSIPSLFNYVITLRSLTVIIFLILCFYNLIAPIWRVALSYWRFPGPLSVNDTFYHALFPINYNYYLSLLNSIQAMRSILTSTILIITLVIINNHIYNQVHIDIPIVDWIELSILQTYSIFVGRWAFLKVWSVSRIINSIVFGLSYGMAIWNLASLVVFRDELAGWIQYITGMLVILAGVLITKNLLLGKEDDGVQYDRLAREADHKQMSVTARLLLMESPRRSRIPDWRMKIHFPFHSSFAWRYLIRLTRRSGNIKPMIILYATFSFGLFLIHRSSQSPSLGALLLFPIISMLAAIFLADVWQGEFIESHCFC